MNKDIKAFLRYLELEKEASFNTVLAYRGDLEQFQCFANCFLKKESVRSKDITRKVLLAYFESLSDKLAPSTIARKFATIRSFFQFLASEGSILVDPTIDLSAPNTPRTFAKPLSEQNISKLFEQPDLETPEGIRDLAILQLMYSNGLKVSEVVGLNLDNLGENLSYLNCPNRKFICRIIPLNKETSVALENYLTNSRPNFVKDRKEEALFVGRRAERLTRQAMWLRINFYSKRAQIKGVCPQTLRHTFAMQLISNGAPLKKVQELLGHTNPTVTTALYSSLKLVRNQYLVEQ